MRFSKTTASLLALGMTVLLAGCEAEQTEKDMLAEAQYCLDKATATTASACMTKISGLSGAKASALRCAAGFIAADVTSPQNLADAMTSISNNSGATGLLAAISFPSVSEVNETFNHCTLSEQSGMALIAAMAKSATIISNAVPGLPSCSGDSAQCESAIRDGLSELIQNPDPEKVGAIVDAVSTVYETSCTAASSSGNEMCQQIEAAATEANVDITQLTPDQKANLGAKLLEQWQK